MRLFHILILIILSIASYSCGANQAEQSDDLESALPEISTAGWALSFGGSGADEVTGVWTDNDGSIYVTGTFTGDCDFDPDRTLVPDTVSASSRDSYLACYDSEGIFQWIKPWGGDMGMSGGDSAIDTDGNAIVTGSFLGTADILPGLGEDYRGSENMYGGGTSSYASKLDADYEFLWAANWESDTCSRVFTDNSGNVYLLGELVFGMPIDLLPGSERNNHGSAGGTDIYLIQLNPDGEYQWSWSWGGSGNELGRAIAIGDDGSVYITGCYAGSNVFPSAGMPIPGYPSVSSFPGIKNTPDSYGVAYYIHQAGTSSPTNYYYGSGTDGNIYDNLPVSGQSDIYLTKINPDGEFEWTVCRGGAGDDIAQDLKFRNGYLFMTGTLTESGSGQPDLDVLIGLRNESRAFLSCIDPDGEEIWTETWGEDSTVDGENSGNALWINEDGDILVTGQLITDREGDTVSYSPGYAGPEGSYDMFLRKYTSEGGLVWEKIWDAGTTSGSAVGTEICVDRIGNIIIGGEFRRIVDFDPGEDGCERTSNGSADAFVVKLTSDGS